MLTASHPLFARIQVYLSRIDRTLAKGERHRLAADAEPEWEDRELRIESGVGKAVHDIYSGLERIFEDIAEEVDGGKPTGESWHMKLLAQMAAETPVRPAIVLPDMTGPLSDVRSFRHVFRESYGMDLRSAEVLEKFGSLRDVIVPALTVRLEYLETVLTGPDPGEPDTPTESGLH